MNKRKFFLYFILFIAIFGFLDAGALTVAKYSGTIAQLCGISIQIPGLNSCLQVQNSQFSYLINSKISNKDLKVPLSLAGVLFYILIIFLSSSLLFRRNLKKRRNYTIYLFILSLIGLIMSIIFEYIQAFIIKAFCKFCAASAIFTLILFLISLYLFILLKKENKDKKSKIKTLHKVKK